MAFELRDYQTSLVRHLKRETNPSTPGTRLLIQVATGGGKTCVINEFLNDAIAQGKRALVVTKDWTLLHQASYDLIDRYARFDSVGCIGDGPEVQQLFDCIPRTTAKSVVYTTIHTWCHREATDFAHAHFDYVIIDELHWGEGASLYKRLWAKYNPTSIFIGFTATPRKWTQFKLVDRAYDFAELLRRGVLARPVILEPMRTNIEWTPERSSSHGDITQASLNELAANLRRNKLIVSTYVQQKAKFGKTIVFACNIDHAEFLANLFREKEVRAEVIHHKLSATDKHRIKDDFKNSRIDVLVNVTMFTHGVDIPDIQTVFLARPTTSDILFSQMIGRGSRRTLTKETFNLVDFVDNIPRYGVPIIRPEGFLGGLVLSTQSRSPALKKHGFTRAPFVTVPELEGYADLQGLEVQPEQTFGIEFEVSPRSGNTSISSEEMRRVFDAIQAALPNDFPLGYRSGHDNTKWNLKYDSSCGLEFTTRILKGIEGFMEVYSTMKVVAPLFERLGYRVGLKTGTHVHLGWAGVPFNKVKELLRITAFYEPALYSMVSPSRVGNRYTKSVRLFFKRNRIAQLSEWNKATRYLGVNFQRLRDNYKTIEIRMHNGTLDAVKILTWVSLWMRIMDTALGRSTYVGDPGRRLFRAPLCPGERGDILRLAEYVRASDGLKKRLNERRKAVVLNSWLGHEQYDKVARAMTKSWYPDVILPSTTTQ